MPGTPPVLFCPALLSPAAVASDDVLPPAATVKNRWFSTLRSKGAGKRASFLYMYARAAGALTDPQARADILKKVAVKYIKQGTPGQDPGEGLRTPSHFFSTARRCLRGPSPPVMGSWATDGPGPGL